METRHTTVTVNRTEYLLIQSDDWTRTTVLDHNLLPIGQIAIFLGGLGWTGTKFQPDDFSSHAFHTVHEAAEYVLPGLVNALQTAAGPTLI